MSEPTASEDRRRLRQLLHLGLASLGIILLIALLSERFAITVPSVQRPHLMMWGLFVLLFGLYVVALRIATQLCDARQLVTLIGLFAVVFRGLMLFTTPIQEIDLYRYVWDGHVIVAGVDPYRFSPQNIIDISALTESADASMTGDSVIAEGSLEEDPLLQLSAIERRSPALGRILRTIHYPHLTSPYPPVSQAVFALAAWVTPQQASVRTHLILMKSWIVLFDLMTLIAMIALLKTTKLPVGWCLAYAWCPLVLKEFANSGHLDTIAVFLTTASLWLLISAVSRTNTWRIWGSAVLLGLGMGAKLYPVILLPIFIVWLARRRHWQSAGLFAIVAGGVGAAALWPMLGIHRPREIVLTPNVQQDRSQTSATGGLQVFLTRWRMNDFLFLLIDENLDPSAPKSRQPWFAFVPDRVRMTIISPVMDAGDVSAASAAFLVTRGVTLGVFACLTMWWGWRLWRTDAPAGGDEMRLLEPAFLTLAWFWLLAPTQNPWYWTWCLPLLPFARSGAWLWVSGLVLTYYLQFWLDAQWPEPPGPFGSRHAGASFFDFILVWFEYVPLFCGLLVSLLVRRRSRQQ